MDGSSLAFSWLGLASCCWVDSCVAPAADPFAYIRTSISRLLVLTEDPQLTRTLLGARLGLLKHASFVA